MTRKKELRIGMTITHDCEMWGCNGNNNGKCSKPHFHGRKIINIEDSIVTLDEPVLFNGIRKVDKFHIDWVSPMPSDMKPINGIEPAFQIMKRMLS